MAKISPKKLELAAVRAAHKAAKILNFYHKKGKFKIEFKGDVNLVTNADTEAEAAIVSTLKKAFPNHTILSEEDKDTHKKSLEGPIWIIDPLDGTTNFSHGFPVFAISIAFRENNQTKFGLIYQPVMKEMFIAHVGKGATLNGKKIKVSKATELSRSFLVTGFPYDRRESPQNNLKEFSAMELKSQAVRRIGAATVDLAYLACGRFDGYWELKLSPWDVAAGALLVTEAGGKVSDYAGNELNDLRKGEILASNGLIHDHLKNSLAEVRN